MGVFGLSVYRQSPQALRAHSVAVTAAARANRQALLQHAAAVRMHGGRMHACGSHAWEFACTHAVRMHATVVQTCPYSRSRCRPRCATRSAQMPCITPRVVCNTAQPRHVVYTIHHCTCRRSCAICVCRAPDTRARTRDPSACVVGKLSVGVRRSAWFRFRRVASPTKSDIYCGARTPTRRRRCLRCCTNGPTRRQCQVPR